MEKDVSICAFEVMYQYIITLELIYKLSINVLDVNITLLLVVYMNIIKIIYVVENKNYGPVQKNYICKTNKFKTNRSLDLKTSLISLRILSLHTI